MTSINNIEQQNLAFIRLLKRMAISFQVSDFPNNGNVKLGSSSGRDQHQNESLKFFRSSFSTNNPCTNNRRGKRYKPLPTIRNKKEKGIRWVAIPTALCLWSRATFDGMSPQSNAYKMTIPLKFDSELRELDGSISKKLG
ncbi:hypothetical protein Tco_0228264 [Tanacetum coccineum]